MPPASTPAWISKLKSAHRNLSRVSTPTISDDGIPTVQAPDSITLTSTNRWNNYIVAVFHGDPPSPAKVFADLNPIWGTQGRISVKHHSKRVYLIYIPCEIIRNWVIEVGYWQSGNCSFTPALWSPTANLVPQKLVSAPVWFLIRHIPQDLWSTEGFSTIASGLGNPVQSEYPTIKPFSNGITKLRVEVVLATAKSTSVRVKDKLGNSVVVSAEILKLPPHCNLCREFGHLPLRCPFPGAKSKAPADSSASAPGSTLPPEGEGDHQPVIEPVAADGSPPVLGCAPAPILPPTQTPEESSSIPPVGPELPPLQPVSVDTPSAEHAQSASPAPRDPSTLSANEGSPPDPGVIDSLLPADHNHDHSAEDDLLGWETVKRRSRRITRAVPSTPAVSATSSQLAADEDVIKAAQEVLRRRLAAAELIIPPNASASVRKKARRDHRQKMLWLSSSDEALQKAETLISADAAVEDSDSASERSRSRSVPPIFN